MWDLALVAAMLDPGLATEEEVTTPPEKKRRKVWMYKTIGAEGMRITCWDAAIPAAD